MTKLEQLIEKLCPNGVEYLPLWSLTAWDKKFNAVEKYKQKKVLKYNYYLAADLKNFERKNGNVKILTTSITDLWTNEEDVEETLTDAEIVCIPWGGNPIVQYYKGKFITGDNRIAIVLDSDQLNTKYLYYYLLKMLPDISSYYRGSGIKHPDMSKVLDISIPVPPLPVQSEIVRILDNFTELTAELTAELSTRKKQYEHFEYRLLFDNDYEKVKLQELCTVNQGLQVAISNRFKSPAPNRYMYITVQFLKSKEDNQYYIENPDEQVICHKDDILVTRTGSTGVIISGVEGCFHNNFFKVNCNEKVDKKYMLCLLRSKLMYRKMLDAASGGSVPDLPHKKFYNLEVPLPPLCEQQRIVAILNKFDTLCNDIFEGLPAEIEGRRKQYEYYRDKLLTFKELPKGYT